VNNVVNYLEFKDAKCKNCYKCLRECPVKAIEVINHQAQIIEKRCILCGKCTRVCPQNAKSVHSDIDEVKMLLKSGEEVIASVAPSFVSSFQLRDFTPMRIALGKLGFYYAEETAIGAKIVTKEYEKMLLSGKYKNLITSACASLNRMIQLYYPQAHEYLAPVDTPMIAHAKLLKKEYPNAKIVFIGPCIAKKREAKECGLIDGVLTFEDLNDLLTEKGINLEDFSMIEINEEVNINRAKYYPISRGIIKSFDNYIDGYEFVAVDGTDKCREVLDNIDSLSGMFLEMNTCEYGCVNGPCSLIREGTAVKASADIRIYANKDINNGGVNATSQPDDLEFTFNYLKLNVDEYKPNDEEVQKVLAQTNKIKPEDELNCGACGYETCKEKAWAVLNGYADIEMCIPYMRDKAELMSYEIIHNSPNGIILLDDKLTIIEINSKAISLFGIKEEAIKGKNAYEYFDTSDFLMSFKSKKNISNKTLHIVSTNSYVEISIVILRQENVAFGVLKDITAETHYNKRLNQVKLETLTTTDEVIKKQMRVAQEIASLLGETTAETKVALLNLKKTLQEDNKGED
jgi:PAS domain S-box-containing protein